MRPVTAACCALSPFLSGQFVQLRPLAIHWIALATLSTLLLIGAVAARVSSSQEIAILALLEGQTARFSVFRIFPDVLRLSMEFDRGEAFERPELGNFVNDRGPGYLEFASPGAPVVLEVR